MILPALNEPDLAELPEEVRNDMKFVPVETLEQVVNVALSSDAAQAGAP
jgi:ATP-dependent Lon protease